MASVEISSDGKRIVLLATYGERERSKQIPGSRWDAGLNAWTLPLSMASCYAVRTEFPTVEIGPRLREWATEESQWRMAVVSLRSDLIGERLYHDIPGDLKPYQWLAAEFMQISRGVILADEQGTGKCLSTITALSGSSGEGFPVLVVCPKSVIPTWEREWAKWSSLLPEEIVVATGGVVKQRKAYAKVLSGEAQVLITNYEALKAHTRFASYGSQALTEKEREPGEANEIEWGAVVADEAHRIRDPKTQITRALKGVSRGARFRFALTGTPVESTPDELWSILNFVAPDEFPAKTKYIERFLNTTQNPWGGITVHGLNPRTEGEFRRLVDVRMLRRTKDLVLPYLPKKVRSTRYTTLSTAERKAYNEMRDEMLAELADGNDLMVFDPMVKAGRLLQMANSMLVIEADGTVTPVERSSKLDLLDDTIQDIPEEDSFLVWFKHRKLLHLYEARLRNRGTPYLTIHGDVSVEDRKRAEDLFQAKRCRMMLLTTAAGAEGLTLTAANTAIYAQRDWSSLKDSQSQDRIHRHGAEVHDQINLIDLVVQDTIEEKVIETLDKKGESIEALLRDRDLIKGLLA